MESARPGGTAVAAVGGVVGQLAKIKGCRAVGIAGSPDKCRYVVDELGFDACINYKTEDLVPALRAACPNGVDEVPPSHSSASSRRVER